MGAGLTFEPIVDVTGAGNAYCGGFVVGLARSGDLLQAGCSGAVSASFPYNSSAQCTIYGNCMKMWRIV